MKPITIVDITEPLQDDDELIITVEVPDEPQVGIAWPRFCANCMRAAVVGVELTRTGPYAPGSGDDRMMRTVVTQVPYCSEHQPSPSRRDSGFYVKLLFVGLLCFASGIILTFLGEGWRDLRLYGWLVTAISVVAVFYGAINFVNKLLKPDAVRMELDTKSLETVFFFRNMDYGRKFLEANPTRGEVVLRRDDESIMFTGRSDAVVAKADLPVDEGFVQGEGADLAAPDEDVVGVEEIQEIDEVEGVVEPEEGDGLLSVEEDFKERTSPSIQPFPIKSSGEDTSPSYSGVQVAPVSEEALDDEYIDEEIQDTVLGDEDLEAMRFEDDGLLPGGFADGFASEEDEHTIADMDGMNGKDGAVGYQYESADVQNERIGEGLGAAVDSVEDLPPPPDAITSEPDSSGSQVSEDLPPPPPPPPPGYFQDK